MANDDEGAIVKGFNLKTVSGGLGVQPSARAAVDTTKPVPQPRSMTPREAQALMAAELLQAVQGVVESTTELSSRIARHGAVNGVLDVALVTLDSSGMYTADYPVTVGSVSVVNHGAAAAMTVMSGPPGSSAPQIGRGVQLVQAGRQVSMPIGQRQITVWGTAGDRFSLQAFTGLQALGVGAL